MVSTMVKTRAAAYLGLEELYSSVAKFELDSRTGIPW